MGNLTSSDVSLPTLAQTIIHRGPDNQGTWADDNVGLGLAHTRLSILDLTSSGHQPIHSSTSRYVMVFNGEIYNHLALRHELNLLSQKNWDGTSDSETLLMAIEQWGLEATLKKSDGMFAIALWDKHSRKLSLARDRMGEKPLYYGWVNDQFVFASELKPIKFFPDFNNEIDVNALALFLRFNSIPAPYSIYKNIFKLEPGFIVTINKTSKNLEKTCFWSTEDIYKNGAANRFSGTGADAVKDLDGVLSDAVYSQMQADVPLGAFLSGGIDSSLIVALMQSHSFKKVNTFSIGFDAQEYNEADHARAVAKYLGTDHFDMLVTERDARDVIPYLPVIYDEPFSDSSQIPTYLVAKLAKQKVTVALSGDGGDELFGGYNRYIFTDHLYNKINKIPVPLRRALASVIRCLTIEQWNLILGGLLSKRFVNPGSKLHKGASVLCSRSVRELHYKLVSIIQQPEDWLINPGEYKTIFDDGLEHFHGLDFIEQMMSYDLVSYLPTDILTKVDRAAMAVSLETRVPFLDPNVIKFSASLPLEYKVRDGVTKWVLREALDRYVPRDLIERPKMGFGVPLDEWLRGPLRDWAESLLDGICTDDQRFFDSAVIMKKWQEHLSGRCNWAHQLWNVLIFQAWYQHNS